MSVKEEVLACHKCELGRTSARFVGKGKKSAQIMFIYPSPDTNVLSNKLYDRILMKCNLKEEKIYRASVLKCEAINNPKTMKEFGPHCIPYLKREIEIVAPKIIFTLGDLASKVFLKYDNFDEAIFNTHTYIDGPHKLNICPLPHFSYLLNRTSKLTDKVVQCIKDLTFAL